MSKMIKKAKQDSWDKCNIQNEQYSFPYHHIPHFDNGGFGVRFRTLHWGFEYLCYLCFVREVVRSLAPSSVLDVGCGDGRFLGMLDWGIRRRLGVDLSERSIRFAKAFHHDVEFLAVNARELRETFDLVVAIEVLEHIPDDECSMFLKSLEERTNDSGHVVIVVPTPIIPLSKKHYRHYDLTLLQKQLEQADIRLEVVNIRYAYKKSRLIELYVRITSNRYWFVELKILNRLIWNYVWRRLHETDQKHGHHLIAILRKPSGVQPTEA